MNTLIILLSFFSLTFAIKESILFDKIRIYLISKSPFFCHLFSCYHCVGFWSGIVIYFLADNQFKIREMLLWGLASAAFSLIISEVLNKLNKEMDKI
jgi:hypothetical protein